MLCHAHRLLLFLPFCGTLGCFSPPPAGPFYTCANPPSSYYDSVAVDFVFENWMTSDQDRLTFEHATLDALETPRVFASISLSAQPTSTSTFHVHVSINEGVCDIFCAGSWVGADLTFSPGLSLLGHIYLPPERFTHRTKAGAWERMGAKTGSFIIDWWRGLSSKHIDGNDYLIRCSDGQIRTFSETVQHRVGAG